MGKQREGIGNKTYKVAVNQFGYRKSYDEFLDDISKSDSQMIDNLYLFAANNNYTGTFDEFLNALNIDKQEYINKKPKMDLYDPSKDPYGAAPDAPIKTSAAVIKPVQYTGNTEAKVKSNNLYEQVLQGEEQPVTEPSITEQQAQEVFKETPKETFSVPDNNYEKILTIRNHNKGRANQDGTQSTVLLTSFEEDGRYKVIPTLFPVDENQDEWKELGFEEARAEAEKRGEVFEFPTEEDAQKFAEGDWKSNLQNKEERNLYDEVFYGNEVEEGDREKAIEEAFFTRKRASEFHKAKQEYSPIPKDEYANNVAISEYLQSEEGKKKIGLIDKIFDTSIVGENLEEMFSENGFTFYEHDDGTLYGRSLIDPSKKIKVNINDNNAQQQVESFISNNIVVTPKGDDIASNALKSFYQDKGYNYNKEKLIYDTYLKKRDKYLFLKEDKSYMDLTEEEKDKYSKYYADSDDYFIPNIAEEIEDAYNEYNLLKEHVNKEELRSLREDADVYLTEQENQYIEIGKKYQEEAENQYDDAVKNSLLEFGILPNKLVDTDVPNEKADIKERILQDAYDAIETQSLAKSEMEKSLLFYDAKEDKSVQGEFKDGLEGIRTEIDKAYNNGQAAQWLLLYSMGISPTEENIEYYSEKIAKNMQEANSIKSQSRVMNRWNQAHGGSEVWDVIKSNPLELAANLSASSISQMLPIGSAIVPTTTATGAAIGSAFTPIGTVGGTIGGLRIGMAATNGAVEYTNAIFEAMRNNGYNLLNPQDVEKALQDDAVMEEGKRIGISRGLTIAAVDYLSARTAGKLFKLSERSGAIKHIENITKKGTEQLLFGSGAEALGEFAAQAISGQEISGKEILAEAIGAFPNNAGNLAYNTYQGAKRQNTKRIVSKLKTKDGVAGSGKTDAKLLDYVNKAEVAKVITKEDANAVKENIALKGRAETILGVESGKDIKSDIAKTMELIEEKDNLTKTAEQKHYNRERIKEIEEGIAETKEKMSEYVVEKDADEQFLNEVSQEVTKRAEKIKKAQLDKQAEIRIEDRINKEKSELKTIAKKSLEEDVNGVYEVGESTYDIKVNLKEKPKKQREKTPDTIDNITQYSITKVNKDGSKTDITKKKNEEEYNSVVKSVKKDNNDIFTAFQEEYSDMQSRIINEEIAKSETEYNTWKEGRDKMSKRRESDNVNLPINYNKQRSNIIGMLKKSMPEDVIEQVREKVWFINLDEPTKKYIEDDIKYLHSTFGEKYKGTKYKTDEAKFDKEYTQKDLYKELDKVSRATKKESSDRIKIAAEKIKGKEKFLSGRDIKFLMKKLAQLTKQENVNEGNTQLQEIEEYVENKIGKSTKEITLYNISKVFKQAIKSSQGKSRTVKYKNAIIDIVNQIENSPIKDVEKQLDREEPLFGKKDEDLHDYFDKQRTKHPDKEHFEIVEEYVDQRDVYDIKRALVELKKIQEQLEEENTPEEIARLSLLAENQIDNIKSINKNDSAKQKNVVKKQKEKINKIKKSTIRASIAEAIKNTGEIVNNAFSDQEGYSSNDAKKIKGAIKKEVKDSMVFGIMDSKSQRRLINKINDIKFTDDFNQTKKRVEKVLKYKPSKKSSNIFLGLENLQGLLETAFITSDLKLKKEAVDNIMSLVDKANNKYISNERVINRAMEKAMSPMKRRIAVKVEDVVADMEKGEVKEWLEQLTHLTYRDISNLDVNKIPNKVKEVLGITKPRPIVRGKNSSKEADIFSGFSLEKMMSFYASIKQEGFLESMKEKYNKKDIDYLVKYVTDVVENNSVLEETINNVVSTFDETGYPLANETYEAVNYQTLARPKEYFPLFNIERAQNNKIKRAQIATGRTQKREGGGDYSVLSLGDAMQNYYNWVNRYNSYKELQLTLNEIFSDSEVKENLKNNGIFNQKNSVDKHILAISESLSGQNEKMYSKWAGWLARNLKINPLMFNPKQFVLQMTSVLNAAVDIEKKNMISELPLFNYISMLSNVSFSKERWNNYIEDVMHSDYMEMRKSNGKMDIDVMRFLESSPVMEILSSKHKYARKVRMLNDLVKKIGFSPVKAGDIGAFYGYYSVYNASYKLAYDNAIEKAKKDGIKLNNSIKAEIEKEARKIAAEKAINTADKVQQSRMPTNLSSFQMKPFAQMFPFMTTKIQYFQQAMKGWRDMTRKISANTKEEKKARAKIRMNAIGRLANYGLVQQVLYKYLQFMWYNKIMNNDEDEEEEEKVFNLIQELSTAGLTTPTRSVPVLGESIDYMINKSIGEYAYEPNIFVIGEIKETVDYIIKVKEYSDKIDEAYDKYTGKEYFEKIDKYEEERDEAVRKLILKSLDMTTGYGFESASKIIDKIIE